MQGKASHQMRCILRLRVNQAIQGLPTSLDEVMTSELFVELDIKDVGSGKYSLASLWLYVGSWLVNGKIHPAPEYRDYVKLLGARKDERIYA